MGFWFVQIKSSQAAFLKKEFQRYYHSSLWAQINVECFQFKFPALLDHSFDSSSFWFFFAHACTPFFLLSIYSLVYISSVCSVSLLFYSFLQCLFRVVEISFLSNAHHSFLSLKAFTKFQELWFGNLHIQSVPVFAGFSVGLGRYNYYKCYHNFSKLRDYSASPASSEGNRSLAL